MLDYRTTMARRLVHGAALIGLILLSIELAARLAEPLLARQAARRAASVPAIGPDGRELPAGFEFMNAEILHPFVGYVADQPRSKPFHHGFKLRPNPLASRRPGEIRIAILGGSLADRATPEITLAFRRAHDAGRIQAIPRVVPLAYPGFKQPQQLNLLSWLLSLGGAFDLVVNIDGYNEISLSAGENYAAGVYPFFPRRWDQRVSRVPDPAKLRAVGRIVVLQDLEASLTPGPTGWLASTATARFVARAAQQWVAAQIELARERLRRIPAPSDFESTGPFRPFRSETALLRALARQWARSSELMDQMVRSQRGEYHHVLQPNQYVEGSRSLTDEERATAFIPDDERSRLVASGYRFLRAEGRKLARDGMRFHDATGVYSDVDETIYVDTCCHVNQLGNDILAQWVVDRVLESTALEGLEPQAALPHEVPGVGVEPTRSFRSRGF